MWKRNNTEGSFRKATTPGKEPHSATGAYDVNITSTAQYKKLSSQNCYCATCGVLGPDLIKSIYGLEHMIEDNSKEILQPFGRDLTK